jgi:hypothetical protein
MQRGACTERPLGAVSVACPMFLGVRLIKLLMESANYMDIVRGFQRPPATCSFIYEAFICMSIRLDGLMLNQARDRPESRWYFELSLYSLQKPYNNAIPATR